jgi:hypothetical protein
VGGGENERRGQNGGERTREGDKMGGENRTRGHSENRTRHKLSDMGIGWVGLVASQDVHRRLLLPVLNAFSTPQATAFGNPNVDPCHQGLCG